MYLLIVFVDYLCFRFSGSYIDEAHEEGYLVVFV